jgi:hypothetical protein
MRLSSIVLGLVGIALLPHLANAQPAAWDFGRAAIDDPFSDYLHRGQSIFLGAGNANATNEAIQTITPWPYYVYDRRIPVEGRQGVEAIQRMYRTPDPFEQQGSGGAPAGAGSPPGGSSPTGLPVTPMQPISGGY